jgi:hypothetical protein
MWGYGRWSRAYRDIRRLSVQSFSIFFNLFRHHLNDGLTKYLKNYYCDNKNDNKTNLNANFNIHISGDDDDLHINIVITGKNLNIKNFLYDNLLINSCF